MHYVDNDSESTYYFVPNQKASGGRNYAERPPPAPTTVPIDDNFDAFTVEGNQETVYDEWTNGHEAHRRQSDRSNGEAHPDYGRYMNEMGKVFGSDVDVEVTLRRARSPSGRSGDRLKEVQEMGDGLRRGSSLTSLRRRHGDRGSVTGDDTTHVSRRRGSSDPRPVELVQRRVLEDGPERTVTIWREEVAKNISTTGSERSMSKVKASKEMNVNAHVHRNRNGGGKDYRVEQAYENDVRMFNNGNRTVSQTIGSPLRTGRNFSHQTYSPRLERIYTSGHDIPAAQMQAEMLQTRMRPPSPCRSERIYTMAELRALAAVSSPLQTEVRAPPPRSERMYSASELKGDGFIASGPHRTSPRRNAASNASRSKLSPKSQSQESSMNAASTSSVDIVLASCQPTLLHIAPILNSLGIRKEEHLRAIARLNEETRDKELKDEALKKGITVMDWAILMDRIQSL